MSGEVKANAVVGDLNIRVMPLSLGRADNAVDESNGLQKTGESVIAAKRFAVAGPSWK